MKSIMKKCFLLAIVLGIAILLIKNWQVDSADQICQTDYTRMNYKDASYVSIVYWKFIGRNGLNDIKDDHYEVRLYSSETGEELSVEDLLDVSRDEVLLRFSYVIRKTESGLRMFWDDLDCLDSDYRKIYYLLTEEGVVIRIVESMRTKVTDFTIGYDEISLFKN